MSDQRFGRTAVTLRAALVTLAYASTAGAQSAPSPAPSPLPLEAARVVAFETGEGTWISLDVSPDGGTIVFELLGDLYTLPMVGGRATPLTTGMAFDAQPRFSPDGRRIVFISDRGGAENVWIMNADGSGAQALTREQDINFSSPRWTPDGDAIVVSRAGPRRTYQLWMYPLAGGAGLSMTAEHQNMNAMGAAFSADGGTVHFARRQGAFGFDIPQWQIAALNRHTGELRPMSDAYGGGARPELSPDGRWLVYASRYDHETGLRIRDLASGEERWLIHPVERDDQQSLVSRDVMPGMAFTPDSRALIVTRGGRLWRVAVPDGTASPIPFQAAVRLELGPDVRTARRIADGPVDVQHIRYPRLSPDGRRLAFGALGRIWVMDVPNGTPRPLAETASPQQQPVWSPDGRYVAFMTWSDVEGGHLYRARADGSRQRAERLTTEAAFYTKPAYSPDGRIIAVLRAPRQQRTGQRYAGDGRGLELHWLPASGGATTRIAEARDAGGLGQAGQPHFSGGSDRVYQYRGSDGLVSMRLDGSDLRTHFRVVGFTGAESPAPWHASEVVMSPTGGQALAWSDEHVYLIDVPAAGTTPTIRLTAGAGAPVPLRRLTSVAGEAMAWTTDGRAATYAWGRTVYRHDVSAHGAETVAATVRIQVPRRAGQGTLALRGARIITMRGDEVIEGGDIVIRNDRIVAVGAAGSVGIPTDATVIDVRGRTIMPGLVDIHYHSHAAYDPLRTQSYEHMASLAYGVTTTRDPQPTTTDIFSYHDLIEAGMMYGPRLLTTGPGVFNRGEIRSLDDARRVLRRYTDHFDVTTIKQYGVGNRQQRQWVIMAAREQGLMATTEGYHDLRLNLTHIIDGYSGHEHSFPQATIYDDVVRLLAASGTTYTPTLLIAFGGPGAENYFYTTEPVARDEKLRRFTPDATLYRMRRRTWHEQDEHVFRRMGEVAARIVAAGGRVGLGSHGQLHGLGTHWELWAIASGGMSNQDALRVGTIFGAEAIGYGQDLGSLEVGKLADLIVLDGDPLENIRNTNTIRYVVRNGEVFDGHTLDQVWPVQRPLPQQHWMLDRPAR